MSPDMMYEFGAVIRDDECCSECVCPVDRQVVVLREGELLESGPPSQLLEKKHGYFATMVDKAFRSV